VFLFESGSPSAAAAFRIAFGVTLLIGQVAMLGDVELFFSGDGVLPNEVLTPNQFDALWSLLHLIDSPLWVRVIHCTLVVVTLCVAVGWRTRLMSVALFVLLISFRNRNPLVVNAGDQVAVLAAMWLIFLDAGHTRSVDAWLRREARPWHGAWALRMIQIQLSVIYGLAALHKLTDPDWLAGTMMFYFAAITNLWLIPMPWIMDHLWLCRMMTWGTILLEALLSIALWWRPTRAPLLITGLLFHAFIFLLLGIPFFGLVMSSLLISFAPFDDSKPKDSRPSGEGRGAKIEAAPAG
jgi:hypothetical protein